MLKTDRLKSLVVLIVAGFIGGAVSRTVLDMIPRASAQRVNVEEVVKARRFELVDSQGLTRAALFTHDERRPGSVRSAHTSLAFYDENGRSLIDLWTETKLVSISSLSLNSPHGNRSVSLAALHNRTTLQATNDGKVVWSAP